MVSVIATCLVMVSYLVFLTTYPIVFIDEPWNSNTAWTWLQTGVSFDAIHTGTLDQFGYEWIRASYLGTMPWVISFAVFGLGLFQARLVSWVFGIILLLLLVEVGRRNYNLMAGVLAALLLSLSLPFMRSSHWARQEIILAALIMTVYILAVFALKKDKWWAHALAGLLIGLSPDIHQNGILFIPGLAALYFVTYKTRSLGRRGTWLVAGGGLIGLVYYVAGHILPSPSAYSAIYSYFATEHDIPIKTLSLSRLLASASDQIRIYLFYDHSLDFALIGASLAYLAYRRHTADRLLLVFVGVVYISSVLLQGRKTVHYAILLYPFFMLMVSEMFVSLLKKGKDLNRQYIFAGALLVLFMFNSTVHYARPLNANRHYDYYAITDRMKEVIPDGAKVMGLPTWWLGFSDFEYRSTLNLLYYEYYNGYSITEGLRTIRPDIVIVEPSTLTFHMERSQNRAEFEDFLNRRGQLLSEFVAPGHGEIQIYRLNWE